MQFFDFVRRLLDWADRASRFLPLIRQLADRARRYVESRRPEFSYENLLLEITLTIQDARGTRAVVERLQRVRFLVAESGVISDLVWAKETCLPATAPRAPGASTW